MMETTQTRQRDLLRTAQQLQLPFPASMRDLLMILGLHEPRRGLDEFLDRFDWRKVTRADFDGPLANIPWDPTGAASKQSTDMRALFASALRSPAFQANAMRSVLTAFPENRRDVFIHIPKCAGTDLALNLGPTRLSVPKTLEALEWVNTDELLGTLADLARNAPFFGQFFAYGHMNLHDYVATCGRRDGDRIFTIVRDPIDLLLSQANYAITRLRHDPLGTAPDVRDTRERLGLTAITEPLAPAELREAAVKALLHERITQPNLMCRYLGRKGSSSAAEALDNVIAYDVEVTDTRNYSRWLAERWGVQHASKHNSSWRILRRDEMLRLFGDELRDRAAEDTKLVEAVGAAMQRDGGCSAFGRTIDRAAAAQPAARSEKPAPERKAATVIFGDKVAVAAHASLLPESLTRRVAKVAATLAFGREGNASVAQLDGWARPERLFTWSVDGRSSLALPRPEVVNDYVLQIRLTPYVSNPQHTGQRIDVTVNGVAVGSAYLTKPSLVECDVPWAAIAAADTVVIGFAFPDAVRPTDIGASQTDQRLLGASFAWLRLSTYVPPERQQAGTGEAAASPLADLMLNFESLGGTTEFGLVQSACGAEPPGVLRFASMPFGPMMKALRAKFARMGEPDLIEVKIPPSGDEYVIVDKSYGILRRSGIKVIAQTPAEVLERERLRLPRLVGNLLEDLALGAKVFVYHGMAPLPEAQARELAGVVRSYGPGVVLWVELADEANPPGSVRQITPRLLKGHVDRFAPPDAPHEISLACWQEVCATALGIVRRAARKLAV